MESAEKPTEQLHRQVGQELRSMGHPAETVPPHEQPVLPAEELRRIGGDVVHSVGSDIDRVLHGEDPHTGVRTVKGNSWLRSLKDRAAGRFKMFQKQQQKPV